MPSVKFPDGSKINFPEGTDQETISRVSAEHWAKVQGGAEKRGPQQLTQGTAQESGGLLGDIGNLAVQAGSGVMEGVASLPGLPVELASWAKGVPLEGSNLEGWGAQGWTDFARRNIGEISAPPPTDEAQRIFRKGGQFLGGGAATGGILGGLRGAVAAGVPSLTALGGSEVGRTADQLIPETTGGYGEVVGALAGGLAPGLLKGELTSGIRNAPSIDDLRAKADAAYKAADQQGVIVGQPAMQRLASDTKSMLANESFHPRQAPDVAAALDVIRKSAGNNATFAHLDKVLRGIAGNAAGSIKPSEARLGTMVVQQIDDFMDSLTPADLKMGDAAKAAAALKEARATWSKMRKAELIDDAVDKARLDASATGTGGNLENRIRQRLKAIYQSPKLRRGFSKPELALMRKAIEGGPVENTLRWFGRSFSPSTGALQGFGALSASGMAGMFIHPVFGLVPAAGLGAKALAEGLASRNASRVSAAVRAGAATPPTTMQRANQVMLEMQRRAKLAGQSAAPAIPGSVNSRQR